MYKNENSVLSANSKFLKEEVSDFLVNELTSETYEALVDVAENLNNNANKFQKIVEDLVIKRNEKISTYPEEKQKKSSADLDVKIDKLKKVGLLDRDFKIESESEHEFEIEEVVSSLDGFNRTNANKENEQGVRESTSNMLSGISFEDEEDDFDEISEIELPKLAQRIRANNRIERAEEEINLSLISEKSQEIGSSSRKDLKGNENEKQEMTTIDDLYRRFEELKKRIQKSEKNISSSAEQNQENKKRKQNIPNIREAQQLSAIVERKRGELLKKGEEDVKYYQTLIDKQTIKDPKYIAKLKEYIKKDSQMVAELKSKINNSKLSLDLFKKKDSKSK